MRDALDILTVALIVVLCVCAAGLAIISYRDRFPAGACHICRKPIDLRWTECDDCRFDREPGGPAA